MTLTTMLEAPIAALRLAGVNADSDPAKLNPPAAWVDVVRFDPGYTLASSVEVTARVYLVVPDGDHDRVKSALSDLYAQAAAIVAPDSPVDVVGLVLPDSSAPLPALAYDVVYLHEGI